MLCRHRNRKQIAEELGISPNTARTHIQNILAKLGLHRQGQAIAYAYSHGLSPDGNSDAPLIELDEIKNRSIQLAATFARINVTGVSEELPRDLVKQLLFEDIPFLVRCIERRQYP